MPTNKFTQFFKNIFKEETLVSSSLELQKKQMSLKIDTLLDTNNKEGIEQFIHSHICFSKAQLYRLLFTASNPLIHHLSAECLNLLKEDNKVFLKEVLMERITQFVNRTNSSMVHNSYSVIYMDDSVIPVVDEYYNTVNILMSNFGMTLFAQDEPNVSLLHRYAFAIQNNVEAQNKREKGQNSSKMDSFLRFNKEKFIDKIVPMYNKVNADKLLEFAQMTKQAELGNVKDSIITSLTEQVNEFSISSLSASAQKSFLEINEICSDLKEYQNSFNPQQKIHFDNIVQKRIPQIIQEYITIPAKYRNYLKNSKDDPDMLLQDSLNEVRVNLTNLIEQLQQNNIQAMKKTNLYLKSI